MGDLFARMDDGRKRPWMTPRDVLADAEWYRVSVGGSNKWGRRVVHSNLFFDSPLEPGRKDEWLINALSAQGWGPNTLRVMHARNSIRQPQAMHDPHVYEKKCTQNTHGCINPLTLPEMMANLQIKVRKTCWQNKKKMDARCTLCTQRREKESELERDLHSIILTRMVERKTLIYNYNALTASCCNERHQIDKTLTVRTILA